MFEDRMAITLKSSREIELMRLAGKVVANVLSKLKEIAEPGVTTAQLDRLAEQITEEAGAQPLFKGVVSPSASMPFPAVICASVNDQIVHGIPSKRTVLKEGDLVGVDFGAKLNGYCADAALTIGIGKVSQQKQKLVDVTKHLLDIAIEKSSPGRKWSRIAEQMQNFAESNGFSVVRDFCRPRNRNQDARRPQGAQLC